MNDKMGEKGLLNANYIKMMNRRSTKKILYNIFEKNS